MNVRMDRLNKLLLRHLAEATTIDAELLAKRMGCLPQVAMDRHKRLCDAGIIQGFDVRIGAEHEAPYELLVVGVPGEGTTSAALERLAGEPAVARVFTLAAHASIAFVLRGDELPALRDEAASLATDVDLEQHQAILVVKTFHDDPHAAAPWRGDEQALTA